MAITKIGMFKWVIVSYAILQVIISIISGISIGATGGGWEELGRATGGRLLSVDRDMGLTLDKLKIIEANPDNYDRIDVENLKTRLSSDFLILFAVGTILFWVLKKGYRLLINPSANELSAIEIGFIVLVTLVVMAGLNFTWMIVEQKAIANDEKINLESPEDIPFYNTFRIFGNLNLIKLTGKDTLTETQLDQTINLLEQNNETSALPDTITIGLG